MKDTELETLENTDENKALLNQCFKLLDSSFEPSLSSYVDIDEYAEKLINNACVVILKTKDTHKFIGLYAIYINDPKKEVAYISSLGVLDDYKGNGYAQYLMEEAIDTAKKAGMKQIRFEVKASYTRAIKFHEKCGFKKDEINQTKDESTYYMYMILQ